MGLPGVSANHECRMTSDTKVGEHELLSWVMPNTLVGELAYLVIFVLIAALLYCRRR
jgi:hypothetical protein